MPPGQPTYRFAGAYADPTGLYKMGHRYYDPNLGRFTQPDPSGQENNPYLYAGGEVDHYTDPTGLFSFADAVGVVVGTAAGAIGAGLVGAACLGTAGVACVGTAVVTGALWGAGGGGLGATIAGGTPTERENGVFGGLLGGATGALF
ncbi:RHS repeat-associated core domain-containing protein [Streptomyces niveus]|uniref:RHS repeat-associated core domain-containing protein n=1 Tax=Streptomyces niveus TaxID=193462 RepID=UPI003F4D9E80